MGFSVALWGRLELAANGVTAWRRARVDPARYDDWTGDFAPPFGRGATTVAKHLARCAKDGAPTYEVMERAVALRGLLDQDSFARDCVEIAAAFRAAAAHGGQGELVFVGLGADVSCAVRVSRGQSSFRDVPERPEWRATIDTLTRSAQRRFDATPIGQARRRAEDAHAADASALRALRDPFDAAALDVLFRALEPKDDFYNPMMEPSRTAMERLCGGDERVAERATKRLEATWQELSVVMGAVSCHLITLVAHHRHRAARRLLAKIQAKDSARFDVKVKAARALLDLATDAEIREVFGVSREAMIDRYNAPNVPPETAKFAKLAKAH